jgi:phage terminase Nu1 subunit (DNA packaging protein)
MDSEGSPPLRTADGKYPAEAFGEWLERRRIGENGEGPDYQIERARLTKLQADKVELELGQIRGSLLSREVVLDYWIEKAAKIRAKLLSLPSRLAPRVAPPDKLVQTQEAAREIIYEALEELAGTNGIPNEDGKELERNDE